jgi:hypothetical protein
LNPAVKSGVTGTCLSVLVIKCNPEGKIDGGVNFKVMLIFTGHHCMIDKILNTESE